MVAVSGWKGFTVVLARRNDLTAASPMVAESSSKTMHAAIRSDEGIFNPGVQSDSNHIISAQAKDCSTGGIFNSSIDMVK